MIKLINKKKLVKFLDNYTINNGTTVMDLYRDSLRAIQYMEVEAIPIKFIKEWSKQNNCEEMTKSLVNDWEEENK